MRWFRRRRGRHQLGAAVTGLPSRAPLPAPLPGPLSAALSVAPPAALPRPVPSALPAPLPAPLPSPLPSPLPAASAAPRVELGFRDGSTASLAPGSPQSEALRALASALTGPGRPGGR